MSWGVYTVYTGYRVEICGTVHVCSFGEDIGYERGARERGGTSVRVLGELHSLYLTRYGSVVWCVCVQIPVLVGRREENQQNM